MKLKNNNRCVRCGRTLKDPVSLAIGMGPECRGAKPNSRQTAHTNRLQRGKAYVDRNPIVFSNVTYRYNADGNHWISCKINSAITNATSDEDMKRWMKQHELAIFPDEYQDSLIYRRDLIIETLNDPNYILTDEEHKELLNELYQIQDVLDAEETDK